MTEDSPYSKWDCQAATTSNLSSHVLHDIYCQQLSEAPLVKPSINQTFIMKKITILTLILLFIISLSKLQAQTTQGDFNLGAAIGYGFDLEEPSLGLNTNYAVADNFRVAGDYIYFFIGDVRFNEASIETTAFELNLNLHYLMLNRENFNIYALTGLNYVYISMSASMPGSQNSVSATEAGINIGSGLELNISPTIRLFSEAKYAFGDASQFILNGGLRFRINR